MSEVNRATRENLARWLALHEAKWGKEVSREKWLNNIVEECSELILAIQHYRRKRVPFSAVRIEMADVSICSEALLTIEDASGPPIMEDIARIIQYQVDILAAVAAKLLEIVRWGSMSEGMTNDDADKVALEHIRKAAAIKTLNLRWLERALKET